MTEACPHDTNGDGDCGRATCHRCHPEHQPANDVGPVVVRCLSLWEPWASLMARGAKTIETRSWGTSYRGPVLICASKRCVLGDLASLLRSTPEMVNALKLPGDRVLGDIVNRLEFGKAVAVVDLVDCIPTEKAADLARLEQAFGDYTPGRFAWITRNLTRIAPFRLTGKQGLWEQVFDSSMLAPAVTS